MDGDTHTAHIVQEHCTGGTLKRWLAEAAAAPSEAMVLGWLAQLALALEYTHAGHRTIHRDVKSSNVFLQPPPPRPSSSSSSSSSTAARPPHVKLGAPAWPLSRALATTTPSLTNRVSPSSCHAAIVCVCVCECCPQAFSSRRPAAASSAHSRDEWRRRGCSRPVSFLCGDDDERTSTQRVLKTSQD